jgi:hypothetical protein
MLFFFFFFFGGGGVLSFSCDFYPYFSTNDGSVMKHHLNSDAYLYMLIVIVLEHSCAPGYLSNL